MLYQPFPGIVSNAKYQRTLPYPYAISLSFVVFNRRSMYVFDKSFPLSLITGKGSQVMKEPLTTRKSHETKKKRITIA